MDKRLFQLYAEGEFKTAPPDTCDDSPVPFVEGTKILRDVGRHSATAPHSIISGSSATSL
jgi:hypothetical protein